MFTLLPGHFKEEVDVVVKPKVETALYLPGTLQTTMKERNTKDRDFINIPFVIHFFQSYAIF